MPKPEGSNCLFFKGQNEVYAWKELPNEMDSVRRYPPISFLVLDVDAIGVKETVEWINKRRSWAHTQESFVEATIISLIRTMNYSMDEELRAKDELCYAGSIAHHLEEHESIEDYVRNMENETERWNEALKAKPETTTPR